MATDGRWTRKRGRRRAAEDSGSNERSRRERVIAVFGYNNQLGIGRRHGFIRTVAVRAAAAPDGHQLGALLDRPNTASPIWADRAYRSAANVALLARRGLVAQVPRPKPRGRDLPAHRARGNASRARVRVAIEHLFAAQKCRLRLVVRSLGLARATARLGLANPVTTMTRLVWFAPRAAPA
jgi:IS5 family transposase